MECSIHLPHYARSAPKAGFTLIEISIVLVVIGLIVGGVLVGQDLIKAAGLRKTTKEVESLNSAVNTFRIKYNCKPGDCPNATDYWPLAAICPPTPWVLSSNYTSPATCNGDGDGLIDGVNGWEQFAFFAHLSNAALINQQVYTGNCCGYFTSFNGNHPTAYQSSVYGQMNASWGGAGFTVIVNNINVSTGLRTPANFMFTSGDNFHYWLLGGVSPSGNVFNYKPVMSSVDAYSIDSKIDDGMPGTGVVQTWNIDILNYWSTITLPLCATTSVATTAAYNITATNTANCSLLFRTAF